MAEIGQEIPTDPATGLSPTAVIERQAIQCVRTSLTGTPTSVCRHRSLA